MPLIAETLFEELSELVKTRCGEVKKTWLIANGEG